MAYQSISAGRISGALGAIVDGVDLSRDLDNATASDLHQALLDHCVIFFRDQHLTPEQHLALGRRFGSLNVHEFVEAMPGHPEILVVAKNEADTKNFGGGWHSDVTYLDEPALGSILYALDVPDYGGDTMFANQYLAYEALSPGMQRMLDGLTAIHSARHVYGTDADNDYARRQGLSAMKITRNEAAHRETEHPVVRTHPETGRKSLYVNRNFTVRFKDMTVEESRPLLNYLYEHAVRPEFTCRFRWERGSIAFWDNRCVQHYALNDYNGQRRVMHRVTIDGDRPF
ncbi:MAG TPA: TauD/TfdA family dioxygenase [Stellaceae bacterium]|nr:TauD/TfdA family dioxygenase [Stellaceae bacterium]